MDIGRIELSHDNINTAMDANLVNSVSFMGNMGVLETPPIVSDECRKQAEVILANILKRIEHLVDLGIPTEEMGQLCGALTAVTSFLVATR